MRTPEQIKKIIAESEEKGYNIWSKPGIDRSTTHGDECEYCLRKCGKNPLHVHVTIDGTIIPTDITDEELQSTDEQSQGCWPIGIGCAKKMFSPEDISKYTFKYKDENA